MSGNRSTHSQPWSRVDLANAVKAVYLGRVQPSRVPSLFNGVSRQYATHLSQSLPSGLRDSETSLALTRAVNVAAGVAGSKRRCYTDDEMRAVLLSIEVDLVPQVEAARQSLIPLDTIKKHLARFRLICPKGSGAVRVKEALEHFSFPSPGQQPYLLPDEEAILVAKADIACQHGKGKTRRKLSAEGRELCHTLATRDC